MKKVNIKSLFKLLAKQLFLEIFTYRQYKIPCHDNSNSSHLKTVVWESNYRPKKIRDALEIKKAKSDEDIQLLNRVDGTF